MFWRMALRCATNPRVAKLMLSRQEFRLQVASLCRSGLCELNVQSFIRNRDVSDSSPDVRNAFGLEDERVATRCDAVYRLCLNKTAEFLAECIQQSFHGNSHGLDGVRL